MKNKWKTIGILGGMGPEASQDIYLKIIQYVQKKYHPKTEADYPPIIIYSLPLNGLNDEGIEDGERIPTQLISGIHALEKAGADFIIIPCNTVHKFYDELVKSSKVPLINVLKVTLDCVAQKNFKKLGLISTQTTVEDKLYHKHCDKMGITLLTLSPYNQIKINSIFTYNTAKAPHKKGIALFHIISIMLFHWLSKEPSFTCFQSNSIFFISITPFLIIV